MTNTKTMKKALVASVISILLCATMLVGTTYAWFTDTATTGVNTIVAGNLDIGFYYGTVADGAISYTDVVDETTKLFNDDALWEPGYTEVAYLKVDNIGSLALKAMLTVNFSKQVAGTTVVDGEDKEFKLSDYLMFDVIEIKEGEFYATRAAARSAAEAEATKIATEQLPEIYMTAEDPAKYYALVVYMPESVGNEANYKTDTIAPSIELCITLIAAQNTVESDSFDNQFDKDAEYPSNIKNNEGLLEALGSSDNVTIKNGNYELPLEVPAGKTLNVEGGDFTIDADKDGAAFDVKENAILNISTSNINTVGHEVAVDIGDGAVVTINDGTYLSTSIQTLHIHGDNAELTINNGSVKGTAGVWCDSDDAVTVINGGEFNVWALVAGDYPSEVPIKVTDGTFNLGAGGLAAHQSHSFNISGGTFNFSGNSFCVTSWATVVITGGTFNIDPSQYVDTTAYDVTLTDGWYTVTAK